MAVIEDLEHRFVLDCSQSFPESLRLRFYSSDDLEPLTQIESMLNISEQWFANNQISIRTKDELKVSKDLLHCRQLRLSGNEHYRTGNHHEALKFYNQVSELFSLILNH